MKRVQALKISYHCLTGIEIKSLSSHVSSNPHLDCLRVFKQGRQLALLRLQVGVASNVLLVDEDVGDGALVGHVLKGVLDRCTIICHIYRQICCTLLVRSQLSGHLPTWSNSIMYAFAPISLNSDLVALQYGQYDLEKTAVREILAICHRRRRGA